MADTIKQTNPFPGLRAFSTAESHLFFGREKQVSELLTKLRTSNILAVVGASGSGKTSLIQGGLIPRLGEGFSAKAGDQWRIATLRPGNNPIQNLSIALAQENVLNNQGKVEPNFATTVENTLKSSSLGLATAYKNSPIKNKANLLIVVDQFEEIFEFNRKEKEDKENVIGNDSLSFINLLLFANSQNDLPIYIVLSMDTDSLANASEFRGLPEVINEGQFLIPRMRKQEIKMAIKAPLTNQGIQISENVVNTLIEALPNGRNELPLLQHCLNRMWKSWNEIGDPSIPIDLEHYESVGTLESALSNHAENAYQSLSTKDQDLCGRIFKLLIDPSRDGQAVKRTVSLEELEQFTGSSAVTNIIDIFGRSERSFLDAPSINYLEQDSLISIQHECLMEKWPTLAKWIEEESDFVEVYLRLSDAANLHTVGKVSHWETPELQIGLKWYKESNHSELWASRYNKSYKLAIKFLLDSKRKFEQKLSDKERKRQDELKKAKLKVLFSVTAMIAGLILGSVSLFFAQKARISQKVAIKQQIRAEGETRKAEDAKITADLKTKEAVQSRVVADQQREIAEVKTVEAIRSQEIATIAEQDARQEAVRAEQERQKAEAAKTVADQERIKAVNEKEKARIAESEARIAEGEARIAETEARKAEERAERLRILGIAQTITTKSISAEDKELGGLLAIEAFGINAKYKGNPNDPYIYQGLHDGVKKIDGQDYNRIRLNSTYEHRGAVYEVASASGGHVFTTGSDGRLMLWNTQKTDQAPEPINENKAGDYRSMSLSPSGKLLVCAGMMPVWEIYKLGGENEKIVLAAPNSGSNEIAIHPNEEGFYAAGKDGKILYCDLNTTSTLASTESPVNTLDVNKNGHYLAAGDASGTVKIYNLLDTTQLPRTTKIGASITTLKFSPSGKYLAIGTVKGDLLMWNLKTKVSYKYKGHQARIGKISFNKSGTKLLTASYDRTVRVWEIKKMNELSYFPIILPHDSWVMSATFKKGTDTKEQIITGTKNGIIKSWHTDAKVLAHILCNHIDRELSEEEWKKYIQLDEKERQKIKICQAQSLGFIRQNMRFILSDEAITLRF